MLKKYIFLSCCLLNACMVGPDFKDPKKTVEKKWIEHSPLVQNKPVKSADWWKIFHDDNLVALIQEGYRNNLSVQMAGVHVLQARAQLAQAVGELYPQQQAMAGTYDYYRIGGGYLQDVLPGTFYAAILGISANWEIDFWGKYRRAIQSNDATFLASIAAYDHALVTLTADIASDYVNIRTTEALIRVTNENIRLQRTSLNLTEARFHAGEIGLLDVEQARTELAETESKLPTLKAKLQRQKDALAVLLGTVPNQVDKLLVKKGIPKTSRAIAVGIPLETLNNRPDVHQSRLEAMAQSAMIGVVKANLFPALSLSGTFSFASNSINNASVSDLFNWSNRTITAGPILNWPLLNYGQITNAVRVQDAAFQKSLLNYQNVVLKAQQEVQDNITNYIESQKTEKLLMKANHSAIKSTQLTLISYREGEIDYTTVLTSEQQLLRVQTSLVQAEGDVPQAVIALYRSLGGGWQIRKGNDMVPKEIKEQMAARTDWGNLLKTENHEAPKTSKQQFEQLYLPSW